MKSRELARPKQIVIIGGGFGGLTAALALRRAGRAVQVTVIDKSNHHLFQPLLYQVATAGLSPADIAVPIRGVLRKQENADVILGEVTGVDPSAKTVTVNAPGELTGESESDRRAFSALPAVPVTRPTRTIFYDYLVIAAGSTQSYFGHDGWSKFAPSLKSIADATEIRRKVLMAFERADAEPDPVRRAELLTFIIIGAGPTGVELAGAISELSQRALTGNFRHLDPKSAKVILIEAGKRLLAAFPEDLATAARRKLESFGVEVHVNTRVESIDDSGVTTSSGRIRSACVIWAAGVAASPAGKWLGVQTDKAGRIRVEENLAVPGHPDVFAIGDTALAFRDGRQLPGTAPVAMQQGRYLAALLAKRASGAEERARAEEAPFKYTDKGNLATVGRSFAIAQIRNLHIAGRLGWLLWIVVHIYYLIGFRNRLAVLLAWLWAYVTFQRGARLIVERNS